MSTSGRPTLQRPTRPGSLALSTSPLGPTPHGSPAPSLSLQPLGPLPWGSLRTKEVSLGTLWPACLGGFRPGPWTIGTICSHSLASWLSRCGRRRRLSLRHKGPQNRPTLRLPPSLSPPRKPSLVSGPFLQLPYQLLSPGPSTVWNFMVIAGGLPWPNTR